MKDLKTNKVRSLDRVFLRLLFLRLFLPTLSLILLALGVVGYLWQRNLGTQQLQIARSLAHTVDAYLDHAGRMLNGVAHVAETSMPEELASYMQASWQAYGYFNTLYRLDQSGFVVLLVPHDSRYKGLDLSRHPYFLQAKEQTGVTISQPFTSLRTGKPTVYMARPLATGGLMVGELSLEALQEAIAAAQDETDSSIVFVADHAGTLLAHPQANRVAQQTNVGYLKIVQRGLTDETTLLYFTEKGLVLGSATPVKRSGWVVVDQVPLSVAFFPFMGAVGPAILFSLAIWFTLVWAHRRQFKRYVVKPLADLAESTTRISSGNLDVIAEVKQEDEIGALAATFNTMTQRLKQTMEELIKREKLSVLGRLTAIVSHDLRNPLGVIRSSAFYLENKLDVADDKIAKHLQRIDEQVGLCDSIVDELLEYTRGRRSAIVKVELNPWIEEIMNEMAIPDQVTTARKLFPELPMVSFDQEKMRRVVINLVENAIQAVIERQERQEEEKESYYPRVKVATILMGHDVGIEVEDNGIGMDEETAGQAFEPLFTTRARGTGLGLAIVKKVVEEHGGTVSLDSEPGRRTRATVVIPIDE